MQEMMTADQAIRMFTRGTNMRWRVIRPDQVNAYQKNVFQLCLDRQCRQSVWVVPRNAQPSYDFYDVIIRKMQKSFGEGVKFLPKIKFDVDDLPSFTAALATETMSFEITVKPTADTILYRKGNQTQLSLSLAKKMALKWSAEDTINGYLKCFHKMAIDEIGASGVSIKIGTSPNSFMINVDLNPGLYQTTINLPPSDVVLDGDWVLERHFSFEITVEKTSLHLGQASHVATATAIGGAVAAAVILTVIFSGGLDIPLLIGGAVAINR